MQSFRPKFEVPPTLNPETCYPFDVSCLKDPDWDSASRKILFVIGYVDQGDIREGRLLATSPAKDIFEIILDEAEGYYTRVKGRKPPTYSMAVVNYNFHRNMHLVGAEMEISQASSVERVDRIIKRFQPTTVVVFGKIPTGYMLGDWYKAIQYGIPQAYNARGYETTLIPVPTYHNAVIRLGEDASEEDYDKAVLHANQIGFIGRSVSSAFLNKMLLTADVKPNPVDLVTVEDVLNLFEELKARTEPFSYDVETNGLFNYGITLDTLQFATCEEFGYTIVLEHKDSPFTAEEKRVIFRALYDLFRFDKPKTYIVGQNISYDLRVTRHRLGIPVIYWDVWDTMAGEHVLDENLSVIDTATPDSGGKSKTYSLDRICLRYGIPWYTSASFSKAQRIMINTSDMSPEILDYMTMDVQTVMAIHRLQLQAASCVRPGANGTDYRDEYFKYVLHTLSCTTHSMSTMMQRGIKLDGEKFKELLSDKSDLKAAIRGYELELYEQPEVQEANEQLLEKRGEPERGLFDDIAEDVGEAQSNWVFDITKEVHKQLLFFGVMKLDPVAVGKKGGKLNKEFQAVYKDNKTVGIFANFTKHRSVYSTYVAGWYRRMEDDVDASKDWRIRPGYSYLLVTGRSNSFNPNLQNVPEHHSSAKYIKQLMAAPIGYVKVDADYSSHEVRVWGIASADKNLANTFGISLSLTYTLRKLSTPESHKTWKLESDPHRINYSGFTGVPVAKVTKEQRQASKGIVFGCFTGDTIVSTELGPMRLADLCESGLQPKVVSASGVLRKSGGAVSQGVKPLVRVMTRMGLLNGTPDHKVQVVTRECRLEMVALKDLAVGDAVITKQGVFGTLPPTKGGRELEILEIEAMGKADSNAGERVPSSILAAPRLAVAAYLRGFFEGRGGIAITGYPAVSVNTRTVETIYDISYLLTLFSIKHGVCKTGGVYELTMTHAMAVRKFIENIGFRSGLRYELSQIAYEQIADARRMHSERIESPIDFELLKKKYYGNAGVENFRFGKKVFTELGTRVPAMGASLSLVIASIDSYKEAMFEFGMEAEYNALKTLSNSRTSQVYCNLGLIGYAEVYDVVNIEKERKWTANGIVVSNSMYGIGDNSLAKSIGKNVAETKEIKGKFFAKYNMGHAWMEKQKLDTRRYGFVTNLLGRRRNLVGHRIPSPELQGAFERRAQNSPIQGVSSDFGYIASRLFSLAIADIVAKLQLPSNKDYMLEHGWKPSLFDRQRCFQPADIDTMVHDSIKSQVRYDIYFVAVYLKEWAMTAGVRNYIRRKYNLDTGIDFGIEIEIGPNASKMQKWNWVSQDIVVQEEEKGESVNVTIKCLKTLFRETLEFQVSKGYDLDVDGLIEEAEETFERAEAYLLKKYPLPYHKFLTNGES